ncbi:MAG: hypothetical protein NXI22_05340 [bacterium]|nr:hypothetical protein [bacterium]
MWRAVWIALGIAMFLFGAEFLLVERLVFAGPMTTVSEEKEASQPFGFGLNEIAKAEPKDWNPPEWLPWTAMSVGAIVVLYSVTLSGTAGDD